MYHHSLLTGIIIYLKHYYLPTYTVLSAHPVPDPKIYLHVLYSRSSSSPSDNYFIRCDLQTIKARRSSISITINNKKVKKPSRGNYLG